jgi:hypothetical protein
MQAVLADLSCCNRSIRTLCMIVDNRHSNKQNLEGCGMHQMSHQNQNGVKPIPSGRPAAGSQ